MSRAGAWRALLAGTLLVILWLALRPNHPGPDWFEHADKLRHALAFATLWLIGRRAAAPTWPLAIGLAGFGGLIEALQSLTPDRAASLGDLVADAVGLALGAAWTRRN